MRLVVTTYRGALPFWMVAPKNESVSRQIERLAGDPMSGLFETFPDRDLAMRYADLVVRLHREHRDRPFDQIRKRAREIMAHG